MVSDAEIKTQRQHHSLCGKEVGKRGVAEVFDRGNKYWALPSAQHSLVKREKEGARAVPMCASTDSHVPWL